MEARCREVCFDSSITFFDVSRVHQTGKHQDVRIAIQRGDHPANGVPVLPG